MSISADLDVAHLQDTVNPSEKNIHMSLRSTIFDETEIVHTTFGVGDVFIYVVFVA